MQASLGMCLVGAADRFWWERQTGFRGSACLVGCVVSCFLWGTGLGVLVLSANFGDGGLCPMFVVLARVFLQKKKV